MSDCSSFPDLLPEWLPDKVVADELFAQAYESCTNAQRGWLKKSISLHFALSGEAPAHHSVQMEFPRLGVRTGCLRQPVAWCVLLLPPDVVSPVRALAAIVPAMLAGVEETIVVRLRPEPPDGASAWPAGLLVGLELAGVRRIVDLFSHEAQELLDTLNRSNRPGRILVLDGCGEHGQGGSLGMGLTANNVRCWHGPRPRIGVCRSPEEPVAANGIVLGDVLAWAHPDLSPDFRTDGLPESSAMAYDTLFVTAQELERFRNAAGLILGPGVEGCWFWPDLDRDFFLRRTLSCSSLILPESE